MQDAAIHSLKAGEPRPPREEQEDARSAEYPLGSVLVTKTGKQAGERRGAFGETHRP